MMGTKDRGFAMLPPVTLEDLVPEDHVSWYQEHGLDLSFVWDLARDR